jgi:hypothetical protein
VAYAVTAGGGSSSSHLDDGNAFAARLNAAGVGCNDYAKSDSSNGITIGGEKPKEEGTCTVDGTEVRLSVYENASAKKNAFTAGALLVCGMMSKVDQPQSDMHTVSGENWLATADTAADNHDEVNGKVADAGGGSVRTISC